jgi:hypothetical protein
MSAGKIQFQTIPVTNVDYQTYDGDAIEVDPVAVKAFIANAIGSTGHRAASPSPQVDLQGSARVTIDVNNGSGVDGLAGRVLRDLRGRGFTAGTVANVSSRTTTVVEYANGGRSDADQVAQYLGGGATVNADSDLRSGHLRILLGSGYGGPDSQPTADNITGSSPATASSPSTGASPPITASGPACVN